MSNAAVQTVEQYEASVKERAAVLKAYVDRMTDGELRFFITMYEKLFKNGDYYKAREARNGDV